MAPRPHTTDLSASLESTLDRLAEEAPTPIIRIESFDGEVIFADARGAHRPGAPAPASAEAQFHLASVTKTMTAVAVLQLLERGSLPERGLDTPITCPDLIGGELAAALGRTAIGAGDDAPTLRHLLTHTGGLRDGLEDDVLQLGGPAPQSLVGRMLSGAIDPSRAWPAWDSARPHDMMAGVMNFFINAGVADYPVGRPGERFHYSDTGYLLLALAVEHVSGRRLHDYWRANIFDPLGMDRTYVAYGERPAGPDGFTGEEAELWHGARPALGGGLNLSFDWGGGGLVSTARDLIIFMRALIGGRMLAASTFTEMLAWERPDEMAPPRSGIGLGLDRLAYGELELWGRTGSWGVRMMYEPNSRLLLAGTLNRTGGPRDWHAEFLRLALRNLKA